MKIVGYVTLYVKSIGNDKVAYAQVEHDFAKPLAEEYFEMILKNIKLGYEELGMSINSVEFCNKEEYELNSSDETLYSHKWGNLVPLSQEEYEEAMDKASEIIKPDIQ